MKRDSSIMKWSVALLLLIVLDVVLGILLCRVSLKSNDAPETASSVHSISDLQSSQKISESDLTLSAPSETASSQTAEEAAGSESTGAGTAGAAWMTETTESAGAAGTAETGSSEAAESQENHFVQTLAGAGAASLPLFLDDDDENGEAGAGSGDTANSGTGTSGSTSGSASNGSGSASISNGSASNDSTGNGTGSRTSAEVTRLLESLTTEEKVAQLFFITPEALTGNGQVTQAGETTQTCFDQFPVGGIIYFQQNIVSEQQFSTMLSSMQSISESRIGLPVFTGVDEEGGSVTRIANRGVADTGGDIPPMGEVGQSGDSQAAYNVSLQIGTYLKRMGITVDFAPVADVHSEVDTLIGDRSFSSDPAVAADMVSESVKGFHDAGVMCTLKHFPGHGSAAGDSHSDQVSVSKTLEELEKEDFVPFQAGIDAGADFVLMGHLSCPNVLDSTIPASLSYRMVTEILRGQLGFDGVVITDAMNMGAIANYWSSGEAAVKAISAGVDMVLMPVDFEAAYQAVLQAVQDGTISSERLDESVRRILSAKMGEGETT